MGLVALIGLIYFGIKWYKNRKNKEQSYVRPFLTFIAIFFIAGLILPKADEQKASKQEEPQQENEDEQKIKELEKQVANLESEKNTTEVNKTKDIATPVKEEKPQNTIADDMNKIRTVALKPTNNAAEGMSSIGELFSRAGENPMMIYNEDWTLQVAASLLLLESAGKEYKNIQTNSEHQEVHDVVNRLHAMGDDLIMIKSHVVEGIDYNDPQKINQASELMLKTGQEATSLTQVFNNY